MMVKMTIERNDACVYSGPIIYKNEGKSDGRKYKTGKFKSAEKSDRVKPLIASMKLRDHTNCDMHMRIQETLFTQHHVQEKKTKEKIIEIRKYQR